MKRVLIIGATSAIASACARLWAAEGAQLFLVGRDGGKLEVLAADLKVRGAKTVHTWLLDANDIAGHRPMLDAAAQSLGAFEIALIAHGTLPDQAVCEANPELAAREIMTNGTSAIALLMALANVFEKQRSGALAVITSVAGDRGRPTNYVYGSAKASVSACCEGLRARLFKSGVSVTDIRPGFVATPMTAGLPLPTELVARPEAIAQRIVSGIERGRDVLYAPAWWALIMLIVRSIPRAIFKRMKL